MATLSNSEADALYQQLSDIGSVKGDFYQDYLTSIGQTVIDRYKEVLAKETSGSGTLAQSVIALPNQNGFEIEADFYFKFIDEGVNAAPKIPGVKYIRPLVKGAPYSFKNLGVGRDMEKSIAQFSGKPLGQAYGIAVSIKKHGIKPHNINDQVLTDEFLDDISEDLSIVLGLAVEVTFDSAFK